METKKQKNLMEVFQEESPEVAQAFGRLIQSVSSMKSLEPKMKQLISSIAMQRAESPIINSVGQRPTEWHTHQPEAPTGRNQSYYQL